MKNQHCSKILKCPLTSRYRRLTHHARVLVNLEDATITYGNKIVCRDIRLQIERGDRVALSGPATVPAKPACFT